LKLSSEGPDSNTVDELEHVGRLFETEGSAPTLLQTGCCTLPLALSQPVLETIDQASTPVVPPIREMFPLGAWTVIEQFGPELIVWVPPGQFSRVFEATLVMWNVS
jgi:hypothetical protein